MNRRELLKLAAAGSASLLVNGCADAPPALGDLPLERPHWRVRLLLSLPQQRPAPGAVPVTEERAAFERMVAQNTFVSGKPEEVADIRDLRVSTPRGDVLVRVYRPRGASGPRPVTVHFHGGGFRMGSIRSYDTFCRALCNRLQGVLVAPEYRLAPEAPFPAGLDDCYAVTAWAAERAADFGGVPGKVALYGDSAGGNLAAAVSQLARERRTTSIAAQVLVYPCLSLLFEEPSIQQFASGYFLEKRELEVVARQYLPDPAQLRNPLVSPLLAHDFRGLPPTLVITAGFDPLRDQGAAYATALRQAGVPVEYRNYRGMIHGFAFMQGILPDARDALLRSAEFVRTALASA